MTKIPDIIIDVRSKAEWVAGHCPGSINIPLDELESREHELVAHKEKSIVVVCLSGGRSSMAINWLKQKGYQNLQNGGGWHTQ